MWILATAEGQETSTISSEPVTEEGQTATIQQADPNGVTDETPPQRGFGPQQMIIFGLMFVVMYFFLFRGPRKKQQKQKQMIQSIKRNDKIRTIGGIMGTVVDVKDNEITLKVDESNNTKIKIVASAVGENLSKTNKE